MRFVQCLATNALLTSWVAMANHSARQRRRRQPIDSEGLPLPNSPFGPMSTFFALKQGVFPTHKLITICGMPKNGITELRSGLAHNIRGPRTSPPPMQWPEIVNKRGNRVLTSVLIRGPFSRFVSWYRSKVVMDISHDGIADDLMKPRESANPKKHKLEGKDTRSLFTGTWNVHLLDSASDANITVYPIEVYAKALAQKGEEFRRTSLDPHLMSQVELCRMDIFRYDVIGALEDVSKFVNVLRAFAGEPAALLVGEAGADGQDCIRPSAISNVWRCSDAPGHQEALLRHHSFKWSHHHVNYGAQLWERELSCEMRLLLHQIYTNDFKELARLGFNYTKELCSGDGGESSYEGPSGVSLRDKRRFKNLGYVPTLDTKGDVIWKGKR
jgi:hypothetical protein